MMTIEIELKVLPHIGPEMTQYARVLNALTWRYVRPHGGMYAQLTVTTCCICFMGQLVIEQLAVWFFSRLAPFVALLACTKRLKG